MKFFCLSAFLVCLATSSAMANPVIDQEYVGPSTVGYILDYPGDYMAQTFTARNTGQITSVALQLTLSGQSAVTDNLHFKLTRTNPAGDPVPTDVLATHDIRPFDLSHEIAGLPMYEIDLRNLNVQVQSGDVLALTLSSNHAYYTQGGMQYVWKQSGGFDRIAGGKFFVYSPKVFGPRWFYQWITNDPTRSSDAGYRIMIDAVPEPSSIFLGLLGIIAFLGLPHRGIRAA
jgi:hypothetical protein